MSTSKRVNYREIGNWNVSTSMTVQDDGSHTADNDTIVMCMLATIRDELRTLNRLLACPNFIAIPQTLKRISRNTAKKRRPRSVGKPKLRVVRS